MKYIILLLFIFMSTPLKSQELNIILSSDSDGQTTTARIFGKYIAKNISPKTIPVFRVVPGAAGLNSTNYLYNVAPRDGSTIGIVLRNIPVVGAIGGENVLFDATRMNWLGSLSDGRLDASVLISNKIPSPNEEIVIGSDNVTVANPIDFILKNTNLNGRKIVGYRSAGEVRLAFLRNEINAMSTTILGITSFDPSWLNKYHVIYQFGNGTNRHPLLRDAPTLIENLNNERAKTILQILEQQFALIRPYVTPPNIPANKLQDLKNAFNLAVKDPEFINEANKIQLVVSPIFAEEATEIVNNTYRTPKELLEMLK